MVEIEEHARLGVDRGFRRVQILGPSLLVGGEGTACEGDDSSRLVSDREHDSVAEFGVESYELRATSFGQNRGSRFQALGSGLSVARLTLVYLVILSGAKDQLFLTTRSGRLASVVVAFARGSRRGALRLFL